MIGTTEHYPPAPQDSSNQSGVSWAAIFAGAAAAASLSLLLILRYRLLNMLRNFEAIHFHYSNNIPYTLS